MLGYRYDDSPVVVPDDSHAPGRDFFNYVPTSRPRALAPDAGMHDGGSLFDHSGAGFTLLAGKDAPSAALDQARIQARSAGVPLKVLQPHEAGIAELYPTRFTLIRPDQHVDWQGNAWPHASVELFEQVAGLAVHLSLLKRGGPAPQQLGRGQYR